MNFVCVDVGSTFTKAVAVSHKGELIATADHRTTIESDVLIGLDAAVEHTGVKPDKLLVCSSAGGGLRLAVIGYERLITAEAGYRVGLTAGARVVHVAAGRLDRDAMVRLRQALPDVVLLAGGADGGDEETITHNAALLANARWCTPIVLAGNASCRTTLESLLTGAGREVIATGNVLPAIGTLEPGPARAAIREVFLRHVIGGKELSHGPRFARLVRGATPDMVLSAVELLSRNIEGDLLVVDVGGATTDVYSALNHVEASSIGALPAARTVEGDLGMRWSAVGVADAARLERLAELGPIAIDPALAEHPLDEQIAALAITIALRRHARSGRDLRSVGLMIGSGGVLRHRPSEQAREILESGLRDGASGLPLPRSPRVVTDSAYVLAAAGLLATEEPEAAVSLLGEALDRAAP